MAEPRECICHASWSGYDEAEYRARGCPSCECWKIDAYEAAIKERDEARATLKASRPDVFTIITEQSYQLTAANAKVKDLEWKLADRIKYTALPYNFLRNGLTRMRRKARGWLRL